ncbi:MAG: hypothetical protein J6038_05280 [Bacilli bacterium]|nr:hypothetical protein [Bacilli bacterium]
MRSSSWPRVVSFSSIDCSSLYILGRKAVFLRCAGFNNVDLTAAFGKIHVYRVPAYSPYAVAEHAMALYLTSNRRIHKAYNRVKEYNFSLSIPHSFNVFPRDISVLLYKIWFESFGKFLDLQKIKAQDVFDHLA